jgi:SulP family sulfate permease
VTSLKSLLPILGWAPAYTKTEAQSDLVAAVIVTIMLVPQSLAYAMLAGLPPQVGLYASILPRLPMRSSAPAGRWRWGRWRWYP